MGGVTFAGATTSAGAPNVEEGLKFARFDGVSPKAVGGQYSHVVKDNKGQDIPNTFEWAFTLIDQATLAELMDEGDPIEVTGLTSMSLNVASKTTPRAVKYLKALMTPAEFAAFQAGEQIDADALVGRFCQLLISIKDSGWPRVDDVIAAPKASKAKAAAAAPAPALAEIATADTAALEANKAALLAQLAALEAAGA